MALTDVINSLATSCVNLTEILSTLNSENQRSDAVIAHIKQLLQEPQRVSDFKKGLEWFNVLRPLSLEKDLKGKVVVLDFFTYCCINCMHILPDLKLLEEEHSLQAGLAVIGVHSAKFDNEKDSANILSAVQRYEISHPVVNDAEGVMWNELGIPCWPTLLILGPNSEPLFILMGEGKREDLFLYVTSAIKYFKTDGRLSEHVFPLAPLSRIISKAGEPILFPGKVATCSFIDGNAQRERLAISDSGHHRILIVAPTGKVEFVIGGGSSGFVDGTLSESKFHSPQGLAFHTPNKLYVADTENHAIRLIDLSTLRVSTVAGTGCQGSDRIGGEQWTNQVLSSPWDVAFTSSSVLKQATGAESKDDVLLIAMAGLHQIWVLFLDTCNWWKAKSYEAGTCVAIVGSGKEENRNNSYPHAAAFAQPSGLTLSPDKTTLYIADSESSSVRKVSIMDGKVSAVVGGDRSPTNLFGFGDVDGKQYDAKLQHPLAVSYNMCDNKLYVADSYNHKIKVVDVSTNICTTLLGAGNQGNVLGNFTTPHKVQMNEPGGLCTSVDGTKLYVADTNNHCIKVVHLAKKKLEELTIVVPSETDSVKKTDKCTQASIGLEGGVVALTLTVSLDEGLHLTPNAPQKWSIKLPDERWSANAVKGDYKPVMTVQVSAPPGKLDSSADILISYRIYFCRGEVECLVRDVTLSVVVHYMSNVANNASLDIAHVISDK